jgi:hypothetical protein
VAEQWTGGASSANSPEDHDNKYTNSSLNSVACFSETACFAVGAHALGDEGSELKTLAEQWSSNAWTLQPTSDPGEYQNVLQGCRVPLPPLVPSSGTPRKAVTSRNF